MSTFKKLVLVVGVVFTVLFSGCTSVGGGVIVLEEVTADLEANTKIVVGGAKEVGKAVVTKVEPITIQVKVTVREVQQEVEQGVEHKFGDAMGIGSTLEQVTNNVFEGK